MMNSRTTRIPYKIQCRDDREGAEGRGAAIGRRAVMK